ncbi:hypothetical protein GUJ93_ZPchr0010g10344 [Zizania palustris]|uniref:Uncharacterized protein n=1 Tax=Zizania palustris TaxID=103762 RepID=A0A8J5W9W6_ZIZPA|nr:hypothetical protein GUJ93_ZPchr0010g10344 [Zizania palustris]
MPQVRMPTMPDKLQVLAIVQVKASAQRMQQQPLEDVEKITVETKEVPICVMRPLLQLDLCPDNGVLTVQSPPSSDVEVEAQEERKDREALSPILIKEIADQ